MPKRRRTRDDATATIVTQRVVNTYSRAQPRQAINKHHFLTPDTPYELKYELPSHLLQGSESSSTTSQAYSEEKPALKSALKGRTSTPTPTSLAEFSSTAGQVSPSEKTTDGFSANTQSVRSSRSSAKARARKGHKSAKRKGRRKVTESEICGTSGAEAGKTTAQSCNLESVSMEMTCEGGSRSQPCDASEQGSTGGIQEKVREFMDIFTSEMKHLQGLSQTTGHQSTAQTEDIMLLSCESSLNEDSTLKSVVAQSLNTSSGDTHVEVASDLASLRARTSMAELSIPISEVASEGEGPDKDTENGTQRKRQTENCRVDGETEITVPETSTRESVAVGSAQSLQKEPPDAEIESPQLGGDCSQITGVNPHTPMANNLVSSEDPRCLESEVKTRDCLDGIAASETHNPIPNGIEGTRLPISDMDHPDEDSGSDLEVQRGRDDCSVVAETRAAAAYERMNLSPPLQLSCSSSADSSIGEDAQTIIKGLRETMKLNVQSLCSKPVRKLRKNRNIESKSIEWSSIRLNAISPIGQSTPTTPVTAMVHRESQCKEASGALELFFNGLKMTPIPGVASLSPAGGSGSRNEEKRRSATIEQTPDLILATKFPDPAHPMTSTPVVVSDKPAMTSTPVTAAGTPAEISTPPSLSHDHVGGASERTRSSYIGSTMERLLEFDEIGFQASQALEDPTPHKIPSSRDQNQNQNGSFGFSEFFDSASRSVELHVPTRALQRSKPAQSVASQTVKSTVRTSRELEPPAHEHKKPYRHAKRLLSTSSKTSSRRKKLCPPIVRYRWNYTMGSTYTTSSRTIPEQPSPSQEEEKEYPVCILARLSQVAPRPTVNHLRSCDHDLQSCDHDPAPVDVLVR